MSLRKKTLSFLVYVPAVFAMILFLLFPARYAQSIGEGISLWAVSVLPATFPFLFLTAFLSGTGLFPWLARLLSPLSGKLFRIGGAGSCAAVLSALSGYPVGARLFLDLRERNAIAEEERFRLSCLCTTSGPMFLVGVVGGVMFGSVKAGFLALFSHLFAVYFVCFLLRLRAKTPPTAQTSLSAAPRQNLLYDSLYGAVVSVLCVGGFIALFRCFGQMLSDCGVFAGAEALFRNTPLSPYAAALFRGLLEMTTGCAMLAQSPSPLSLALACFLTTFGGLCVLCQQFSYLGRAGVPALPFLAVKLAQAILSGVVCFAAAYLFGI